MNLRDLSYLVALVEHRHFGKAAEACFVSQPALSMQIKKLEGFLDVQLLERSNKSVMLTEAGLLLADRAREVLSKVAEMRDLATTIKDPFSGDFKLGIFPTLAPYLLPSIIPDLTAKFPKLKIYLVERQTASLLDQLRQGKIDAAILGLPIKETGLNETSLFSEEYMLAVPKHHHFAKRKSIKQADLGDEKILLMEDGHCLRDQALDICYKVNAKEMKGFWATSLETLRHMVAAGVGITLIPKLACHASEGVVYVPFSTPKPSRELGMIWRTSTAKHVLLDQVSAVIKKIAAKHKSLQSP